MFTHWRWQAAWGTLGVLCSIDAILSYQRSRTVADLGVIFAAGEAVGAFLVGIYVVRNRSSDKSSLFHDLGPYPALGVGFLCAVEVWRLAGLTLFRH